MNIAIFLQRINLFSFFRNKRPKIIALNTNLPFVVNVELIHNREKV